MKALLIIVAIIVLVYLVGSSGSGPGVKDDSLLRSLRSESGKCDRMMKTYQDMGLVRRVRDMSGTTYVDVEDRTWASISHDMKVSVGLVAYCIHSPDSGRHLVMIRGYRDGAGRGSVTNGNWFSP